MHDVQAKSLVSAKNGFNIYRGCTHGCIYCDSRSLCYQMDHAFEDVEVKANAPQLLEAAIRRRRKRCMLGTGAMSDPYLPLEKERRLTRQCLEIICRHGFGVSVLTKSDLILRDMDLLAEINAQARAVVQMTLTTCDEALCRIVEPHVCTTARRYEVLLEARERGIPTVVWLCPLLPWLNDTEANLRGILDYCIEAGVVGIMNFGMGLTLRAGDRAYFYAQLDKHFPGLKARYQEKYGQSYILHSPNAARLTRIFQETCQRYGILWQTEQVFSYLRTLPEPVTEGQYSFF